MVDSSVLTFRVIALVIVVAIVSALLGAVIQSRMETSMSTVKAQDCGEKTIQYINNNLVQSGTKASLVTVNEDHGMYQIVTLYQSQQLAIYASEDCTLLFPTIINMTFTPQAQQPTKVPAPPTPLKSAQPIVDLYVMAFCPYGTQAEQAMAPVQALLGSKAKINVRFITSISGTTVSSLHGSQEAKEDLRQTYIQSTNPALYWKYLTAFDSQCYPVVQNQTALDACRNSVMTKLGLDPVKVETESQGSLALTYLKADATDVGAKGITGSPTLIINGITYSGSRTPEAYKEFICNSFTAQPGECNTNLSTVSAAASGNCG